MFHKLLIANRGEIACRIIRTAKRLGLHAIAVYSEVDKTAEHVAMADEAYPLGHPRPNDSYLNIDKIIHIAKQAKADAIHPGYGFLSENPEFAEACEASHITFVGPPSTVIRQMGLKSEARDRMQKANVPVVPGFVAREPLDILKKKAAQIGFPILIKPIAGGGGKGMHIVSDPTLFEEAMRTAEREAKSAFGHSELLIEKYLPLARHVEIQIFADFHGSVVHLFERDCSIQRRHQKVIEETPAPHLSDELKKRMWATAVTCAKTIGYVNAGTVEFLVDASIPNPTQFYFMEMNTRLQVEHVVTEMVTGLDLVEWQLHVASGFPLPLTQEEIVSRGHAIEARIYAEEEEAFLPAAGKVHHIHWPESSSSLRIETALKQDDEVSVYYDPLLAKIIAYAPERSQAVDELSSVLLETEIGGVLVNTGLLYQVLRHPDYREGRFTTDFIATHKKALLFSEKDEVALQALLCGWLVASWGEMMGWTMNGISNQQILRLHILDKFYSIPVFFKGGQLFFQDSQQDLHEVKISQRSAQRTDPSFHAEPPSFRRSAWNEGDNISIILDESETTSGRIREVNGEPILFWQARAYPFKTQSTDDFESREEARITREITAPMTGTVVAVFSKPHQKVKKGEKLLILEAMKMEHVLLAPYDAEVKQVYVKAGELVHAHAPLVEFL